MDEQGNLRRASTASSILPQQYCVACPKAFAPGSAADIYCETCKGQSHESVTCELCRLPLPSSVKAGVHCICRRPSTVAHADSDSDMSLQRSLSPQGPSSGSDARRPSTDPAGSSSDPMPTLNSPVSNPTSPPTGMTTQYVVAWGPPPMTAQEEALISALTPADLELTADVEVEINRSHEMDGLRRTMGAWRNVSYSFNRAASQRRSSHVLYQERPLRLDQDGMRRSL